jgi:DNA-binding response OmpR family regulator
VHDVTSSDLAGWRVLAADDNDDHLEVVCDVLARAGAEVVEAKDGAEAIDRFYRDQPHLVVLDVRMPKVDGWQTLEQIRTISDRPVLMLTAADSEVVAVRALRAGADDYVRKPFSGAELVARAQVLLRTCGVGDDEPLHDRYHDAHLEIDFRQVQVRSADQRPIKLRPLEYRLLVALVRHPNQVLSGQQLVQLVWNDDIGGDARLKVYISYLRAALRDGGVAGDPIVTLRGLGYRYVPGDP